MIALNFYPSPGSPASPVAIHAVRQPCHALRECLAADLDRDEDEFDFDEVFWGDDGHAEVVMLDGEIIGSLDFPLNASELAEIKLELARERYNFDKTVWCEENRQAILNPNPGASAPTYPGPSLRSYVR